MFRATVLVLLACCSTGCLGSGWKNNQADVFFVLDGSISVWSGDFKKELELVARIVSDMDIGPDKTRVGLGSFSEELSVDIPLNTNYDKASLMREIREVTAAHGTPYISRAIQGMRQQLANNVARSDVPRIAVLITVSKSRFYWNTYENVTRAKSENIFPFVIGVGSQVDQKELVVIAGDPKREFLYNVDNFNQLSSIESALSANMAKVNLYQNDKGTCGETARVDTVFVYDEYALGATVSATVKTFLKTVAEDFRINPGNVRVGVVSKSCHEGGDISLGDFVTREEFTQALDKRDKGMKLDELVKRGIKLFDAKAGSRADAKKRIVVVLDRPIQDSTMGNNVFNALFTARIIDEIEVFIIRLGTDYDKSFLGVLATDPEHVLYVETMEEAIAPFMRLFCKDI